MTSTLHAAGIGRHRVTASPAVEGVSRAGVGRALGGLVVITIIVLGLAGFALAALPLIGWQSVILATGSMSPGLPAGSLVIERGVAASELEIGDIVTVARDKKSPVTHRVIDIAPAAAAASTREITLQGDANDDPDPRPYTVEKVGLVELGIPGGGKVIEFLRTPLALGLITVVMAGLVLRAWWPHTDERDEE